MVYPVGRRTNSSGVDDQPWFTQGFLESLAYASWPTQYELWHKGVQQFGYIMSFQKPRRFFDFVGLIKQAVRILFHSLFFESGCGLQPNPRKFSPSDGGDVATLRNKNVATRNC